MTCANNRSQSEAKTEFRNTLAKFTEKFAGSPGFRLYGFDLDCHLVDVSSVYEKRIVHYNNQSIDKQCPLRYH